MKLKSLAKDYKIFADIVVFGSIAIATITLFLSYRNFNNDSKQAIAISSKKITQQITESLSYVENISNFIANQIVDSNSTRSEKVARILLNSKLKIDQNQHDIFTWTLFDFVNTKNYVTASSTQGVLLKPTLITNEKRSWVNESRLSPWKLVPSKADIGIVSKEPIIPFGFGITKNKNDFIGIISLGVNINKLLKNLNLLLTENYVEFAIIDKNNSIAFTSENFDKKKHENLEKSLKTVDLKNAAEGFVEIDHQEFYYQKISRYQFGVLTSVNQKSFILQFSKDFLPKALNTLYLTVFFLILMYFFRKKLLNPITKLSEAAENLSQGNLDVAVPLSEIAEINMLSSSIDKVKAFLKAEEAIKHELKAEKDQAEDANYHKTEFLSSTAHELKNMIAGIVGLAELAKIDLSDKIRHSENSFQKYEIEELVSSLKYIISLGDESSNFVNDILDVNQAQTGEFKIEEESLVDLGDTLLRSVKLMKIKAIREKNNIVTNFDKNSDQKFIASDIDSRRVKQIIVNIISNAIKYSPKNTDITVNIDYLEREETIKINEELKVKIEQNNNIENSRKTLLLSRLKQKIQNNEPRIAITVEDHGNGMSDQEIELAMKKYGTIKENRDKRIDSTGLGLPIVKYLVEVQGGALKIESKKTNGTIVRIIF